MKRRFCELNVIDSSSLATNLENVKQLIKLGYHVVAITHKMDPPTNVNKYTPKPTDAEIHSFANSIKKLKTAIDELKESAELDYIIPNDFELLSRITVDIETPGQGRLLKSYPYKDMLNDVDLIAVCPGDETVCKSIIEGKIDCDIIALELENEPKFKITPEMVRLIIAKNISFEISYSHAIKSISLRKCIFKNGRRIVQRSKKAKGIIMCSHGDNPLDFRSPLDVINLAHLFDISDNVCYDVVSKNSLDVISHAKLRKFTFLGAVAVEKIVEKDDVHVKKKRKIIHDNA